MVFSPNPIEGCPWAFIALMGVTGSGKSSFIRAITENEDIIVGHEYESCTSDLSAYSCHLNGYNVNLIDTPGFNDTYRSDAQILESLATWFAEQYRSESGQCLNGIVYLHDISEIRMKGSALLNLRMFRELCGKQPLRNVVLATNFWSKVDRQTGTDREQKLRQTPEFWGGMIEGGSQMYRYTDRQSGIDIITSLLDREPMPLKIQTEIVDEQKLLIETGAGQEVNAEIARLQQEYKTEMEKVKREMEEALLERDEETQRLLAMQQKMLDRELEKLRNQREQLRADRRADIRRREEEFFSRFDNMSEENQRLRLMLDEQAMQKLSFDEAVAKIRANEAMLRIQDREDLEAKIAALSASPDVAGSVDGTPVKKKKGTSRFLFAALRMALPITTSILIGIPLHWPSTGADDTAIQ